MKRLLLCVLLFAPTFSHAHVTNTYLIDTVPYEIVVGSVGEPVVVDDKTGVSVEIVRDGEYLADAESMLQVELKAGETSRVQPLVPLYGNEGIYRSKFIATKAGILTYRLFGTLEGKTFDVQFSCNPIGHKHTEVDKVEKLISEGVIQTSSEGMFSCPESKEALGFPDETASIVKLQDQVNVAATRIDDLQKPLKSTNDLLGALALFVSLITMIIVLLRTRKVS